MTKSEPVYVLWFEEFVNGCGHYQSIEPDTNIKKKILTHYRWLFRNEISQKTKKVRRFQDLEKDRIWLPCLRQGVQKRRKTNFG